MPGVWGCPPDRIPPSAAEGGHRGMAPADRAGGHHPVLRPMLQAGTSTGHGSPPVTAPWAPLPRQPRGVIIRFGLQASPVFLRGLFTKTGKE